MTPTFFESSASPADAEVARLKRECLEWQAALHWAETEARQCGFTGSLREPGPALLEILNERDGLTAEVARLRKNIATLLANIADPGFCGKNGNGCGQEIWWAKTKLGKAAPLNADGSSHFGTCAFRKGAKT